MRLIKILICAAILPIVQIAHAQEKGELALTVSPAFKWLTSAEPYGNIHLTNDGTGDAEITITTTGVAAEGLFGSAETSTPAVPFGDLTERLVLFPSRMILAAGETRIVRYSIDDAVGLPTGGHVAFVHTRILPRTPINQAQTPVAAAALRINYEMVVPLVMIAGVGEPAISIRVVSHAPEELVVELENTGNSPWGGRVHLESVDGLESYGLSSLTLFRTRELVFDLEGPLPDSVRFVFDEELYTIPQHSFTTPAPITITL